MFERVVFSLQWRHNERHWVSITSVWNVYSTVCSGGDQRNHQSSASLAFVRESTSDRWIPFTNGQWRGKWFHLMASSCVSTVVGTGNDISQLSSLKLSSLAETLLGNTTTISSSRRISSLQHAMFIYIFIMLTHISEVGCSYWVNDTLCVKNNLKYVGDNLSSVIPFINRTDLTPRWADLTMIYFHVIRK